MVYELSIKTQSKMWLYEASTTAVSTLTA